MERSEAPPDPPSSDAELYAQSEAYWAEHVAPKPSRVLTLTSDNVALRVKGGGLQITDPQLSGARHLYFAPSARKPNAIVLSGWGGLVTIEALRFCDDYKIALIVLDWTHGLMSVSSPNPKASAGLVRAQCAANAVEVARGLIEEKVKNAHVVGGLTAEEAARFIARANQARTVDEVMQAEAHAAKANFAHAPIELHWRPGGPPIPPAWKRYVTRTRMINEHSPRRATHPINALLNLAATIAAGRLTAQLAARGACLSIGFLHADKPGRFSLTYDAIEPLRPFIEAKTFAFLGRHQFAAGDFIRVKGSNELRIMDGLLAAFTQETALSERAIQAAADFALMLIQSPGNARITHRGSGSIRIRMTIGDVKKTANLIAFDAADKTANVINSAGV